MTESSPDLSLKSGPPPPSNPISSQSVPAATGTIEGITPRTAEIDDAQPVDANRVGLLGLADGLLRQPAAVFDAVGRSSRTTLKIAFIAIASMTVVGLVMASFPGGMQYLWVPVKVSIGLAFASLLCFPSLYILASLGGSKVTMRQTLGALTMGVSLMSVLLVGFAPVTWVFSQATSSVAFMGTLHLLFFGISGLFGFNLLRRCIKAVSGREVATVWVWAPIFAFVLLQLTTSLRPLIGQADAQMVAGRLFFLEHWVDVLSHNATVQ